MVCSRCDIINLIQFQKLSTTSGFRSTTLGSKHRQRFDKTESSTHIVSLPSYRQHNLSAINFSSNATRASEQLANKTKNFKKVSQPKLPAETIVVDSSRISFKRTKHKFSYRLRNRFLEVQNPSKPLPFMATKVKRSASDFVANQSTLTTDVTLVNNCTSLSNCTYRTSVLNTTLLDKSNVLITRTAARDASTSKIASVERIFFKTATTTQAWNDPSGDSFYEARVPTSNNFLANNFSISTVSNFGSNFSHRTKVFENEKDFYTVTRQLYSTSTLHTNSTSQPEHTMTK